MSTSTSASRVTVNCPSCQTVNPDADVNTLCSSCGEPVGVAVFQHSVDEILRLTERARELNAPSFKSFNGFGTTLLDYRRRDDGGWEASRWVIAAGLPVAPLASYVISPKRQEASYGRMESYFEILGRVPLSPARILRVYALVGLGLAPVVLGFMNSRWVNRTLGGPLAVLAMLASIVWAAYVVLFLIKNDTRAYKRASGEAEAS